ncbi:MULTISPECIES: hypothetical protein [Bacillus subtilis group]|uniref:hypothetical protein n=1 Tax=Bacillus subtilis group TaxID=653685 RepID=UPI0021D9D797|nr:MULTISPECIES: hypothetical protein [Bacillus subtilis group]MCY9308686.1 hypothetical protein [Bacillus inaquosorum]
MNQQSSDSLQIDASVLVQMYEQTISQLTNENIRYKALANQLYTQLQDKNNEMQEMKEIGAKE